MDITPPATRVDEPHGEPQWARTRPGLAPVAPPPATGAGTTPPPPRGWKRTVKRLFLAGLACFVAGLLLAGGLVFYYSRDLPKFDSLKEYAPLQTTKVLAADGSLAGEIFVERRTVVPMADIPAVMVQALVSAEDANFFEHSGIDYVGILKAFVGNLRPGAHTRGASTLTQQTVKTFLLSNERKLSRKIKEAILSLRLERNLQKQDILYLYLNQIYFGNRRYGIEEAARYYFGHGVKELTLGEAAVLASIPKSPNELNPRRNMKRAKERQTYVLRRMVENGYLAKEVAEREIARPIQLAPIPQNEPGDYYVEEVRRLLVEDLGEQLVTGGGLVVETMMDREQQAAAEAAAKDGLRALDKRQGWRGAVGRIEDAAWEKFRPAVLARLKEGGEAGREGWAADSLLDLRRVDPKLVNDPATSDADFRQLVRNTSFRAREPGTEVVARVEKVARAGADLDLGTSTEWLPLTNAAWARPWNPTGYTAAPKSMHDVVKAGDLVLVRVKAVTPCSAKALAAGTCAAPKVELALEQNPVVEAALVAIDPKTRGVTALVGGFDHKRSAFNRATQAKRQPGSSFKPFVYAAALETGRFTARTTVYDTPELIRDRWTGKPWQPRNFERDFFAGPMSLRKALAESKNTVAVKLIADIGREPNVPMGDDDAQDLGLTKVKDLARRAGIDSPIPDSITAALGSGEVIPLELVNAYATLAMQGRYSKPVLIRRVRSPGGEVLLENKPAYEQQPPLVAGMPAAAPSGRGLRPDVAFITGEIMRSVVEDPDGTARSLQKLGRPIAGKTGTASEHRDAWFVGYTPELVTGVWVGFDDHSMLGPRETGGHAAGPIWLQFMQAAEAKLEPAEFEPPPGVVVAQIDPRTGLLADEHSPYVEREVYVAGTEPTEVAPPADQAKPEDFLRGEGP